MLLGEININIIGVRNINNDNLDKQSIFNLNSFIHI